LWISGSTLVRRLSIRCYARAEKIIIEVYPNSTPTSRVGGKAQRALYRAVAGDLKLDYAQFEELESFARFGARLDEDTRRIIEHGRCIRACLKQTESAPVSVREQIVLLLALTGKLFDNVPCDRMADAEQAARKAATDIPAEVWKRIEGPDDLDVGGREQ
jgi:F-type H+-transporting ATPase subunit alpha